MTLWVPLEEFAAAARRVAGGGDVYLQAVGKGTLLTTVHLGSGARVACRSALRPEDVRGRLEALGLTVHQGAWGEDGEVPPASDGIEDVWVAAIAYVSNDDKPGLWVDGWSREPTEVEALEAMHGEMERSGEIPDVPFETFLRDAKANVVVLSPSDLVRFARERDEAEPCP